MKFNPVPKQGMPPKKAKKPLKRTAIKKNYDKIFNTSKKLEKRKSSKSNREVIPGDIQDLFGAKKKSSKKRKPIQYRRKPTGELATFKEIWEEREHVCQVTGLPIHEFSVMCMSHVMTKSIAPELRLDKRNIWIVLPSIHQEWETGNRNQPKFDKKRELFEQLKIEINNK